MRDSVFYRDFESQRRQLTKQDTFDFFFIDLDVFNCENSHARNAY